MILLGDFVLFFISCWETLDGKVVFYLQVKNLKKNSNYSIDIKNSLSYYTQHVVVGSEFAYYI